MPIETAAQVNQLLLHVENITANLQVSHIQHLKNASKSKYTLLHIMRIHTVHLQQLLILMKTINNCTFLALAYKY